MSDDDSPGALARAVARELRSMGPGDLAALRRADRRRGEVGLSPAWWRLVARHPRLQESEDWEAIVQAVAILTPKGAPEDRPPLHDPNRRWGTVLCDGGDAGWRPDSKDSKPAGLSERRLAQLLAARGEGRRVLTLRAARAIAAKRGPASGLNVEDLAWSLLAPDRPEIIARPYYATLDAALRAATATDTSEDQDA